MEDGFLKLSRRFFSNEMWKEARVFSECEAWLDLIQSARFDATGKAYSEYIGGREISYTRGQYPASIRFLSKRWRWSERAVRSYLEKLRNKRMISTDKEQGINIITLLNYEKYNGMACGTANDTPNDTDNNLNINNLQPLVTQLVTQQLTQALKGRHTGDTKKKKEEDIINPPFIPPRGRGFGEEAKGA